MNAQRDAKMRLIVSKCIRFEGLTMMSHPLPVSVESAP